MRRRLGFAAVRPVRTIVQSAAWIFLAGFIFSAAALGEKGETGGKILFQADSFTLVGEISQVDGWSVWNERPETRPEFGVAVLPSLGGSGSLMISGAANSSAHGCWLKNVTGIEPGKCYSFEASYQTESVPYPRQQVTARQDWRGADSSRVAQPEYVSEIPGTGKWRKAGGTFRAPDKAVSV
ncbi:MAG TPA: hypothetical protein VM123_20955, partial [archaeon]|nr:hypothetical protein [archaeon]